MPLTGHRMTAEDNVYGPWPKSGEIDLMESRGNDSAIYPGGRDTITSTLHWGLDFGTDKFLYTTKSRFLRRTDYSEAFHTYGLEWSENYLYTYVDKRLEQALAVGYGGKGGNMWARGNFAAEGYASVTLLLIA